MVCPRCQGNQLVKNGRIHNGKPKWKCKTCGRQFVAEPTNRRIADETKALVDALLLERISLAGIARTKTTSTKNMPLFLAPSPCRSKKGGLDCRV
jgi:insertion element IS1 protein InsB